MNAVALTRWSRLSLRLGLLRWKCCPNVILGIWTQAGTRTMKHSHVNTNQLLSLFLGTRMLNGFCPTSLAHCVLVEEKAIARLVAFE